MAFGGTNFGTSGGANGLQFWFDYMPHITSYDYDSPINEQGSPTSKYFMLRNAFQNYYGSSKPLI